MATILIKKYSNRKLYDQSHSRYVTLDEIASLIREGHEVQVVDATTGEDLTGVTLAQVILENERAHKTAFPAAFLHQLIKHGEVAQQTFQKLMTASLDAFLSGQQEAGRAMRDWAARAGWVPPGPEPKGAEKREGDTGTAGDIPSRVEAGRGREDEVVRAELEALKEKVRQLEQRLGRPS
jgi:polyhydroxyalkanoate synthesis repressor PhaR